MAASDNVDSWGQSSSAPAPVTRKKPASRQIVPDDWDNDLEDDTLDNKQIWEEANTKPRMPEIIASSATSSAIAPPAAAFDAPLRILKRPSPDTNSSTSSIPSHKSFAKREADYQAARERIFSSASQPQDKLRESQLSSVNRTGCSSSREAQDTLSSASQGDRIVQLPSQ